MSRGRGEIGGRVDHYGRGLGRRSGVLVLLVVLCACTPRADKELSRLASTGDAAAQFAVANELLAAGKRHPGIKSLRKAAQQGHGDAQLLLGRLLVETTTDARSATEGERWLAQAAAQGISDAHFVLGSRCEARGEGAQARVWFERAASQGHPEAIFRVGQLHAASGEPDDLLEALEWFAQSAALDHPRAMFVLGALYARGVGVPCDIEQARYWYEKAALRAEPDAQYNLAISLMEIDKNYHGAAKWALVSAKHTNGHKREQAERLFSLARKHLSTEEVWQVEQLAAAWQPLGSARKTGG